MLRITRAAYLITQEIVLGKLRSLPEKLSRTPDGLPPILFRKLADELAVQLTLVYQRSYREGCVPALFKTTIITPILKKGRRDGVGNYRPIAQASIACIVFEKIVAEHLSFHLDRNSLHDPQ